MTVSELARTPLHECHREAGARLVEFAGWEMPVQYAGVIEEHRAVRQAAGLFDVSHMGEIAVRGPGAEALLQRLTPNDVGKLAPGRAHYSGLLTERGTYVDDLLVYRLAADELLVVVNASNAARDLDWMRARAGGEEAEVVDVSDRYALLALQGPRALAILQPLATPDLAPLRYYGFARGTVAGRPAILSRTGYTGEDGFELYLAPEDAPEVWRRLLAAGRGGGLVPAGLGARDTLRLEAGMALYGHEIDDTTTPFEAGLDWVVKLDKGDFVGRDALAAQRREGIRRKLAGFEIEGRGIARQGHAVVDGSGPVGVVTSGTWSPTFEKALGMAYVPVELAAPGARLAVDVRGRALPAAVVGLPFYRRPR
ncbi:MAG TPA: glycine cleavage system aminomethyltransferase GcvT [Thermoanaerobaculia bacterium]|nr:glycine cleavage system aminomethyltransferase GcvT [Thermoanaerobaculia bacterium]